MNRLSIQRPDDWHVHLRDGEALEAVAHFTAARFGRAIVMPNLNPAVTTTAGGRPRRSPNCCLIRIRTRNNRRNNRSLSSSPNPSLSSNSNHPSSNRSQARKSAALVAVR